MKITYVTLVADEPEFFKLYENLRINKREEDNIVVLADSNKLKTNQTLQDEIYKLSSSNKITLIEDYFTGNFAEWRNKVLGRAYLNDWLIFLDSDERLPPQLIDDLPLILELNPDVDVIGLPRANYVKGITPEDIQKWGWRIDSNQKINWPDIQFRIARNKPGIRWEGVVHETLVCPGIKTTLPEELSYAILHYKDIERQRLQNGFYDELVK